MKRTFVQAWHQLKLRKRYNALVTATERDLTWLVNAVRGLRSTNRTGVSEAQVECVPQIRQNKSVVWQGWANSSTRTSDVTVSRGDFELLQEAMMDSYY